MKAIAFCGCLASFGIAITSTQRIAPSLGIT